jgi:hypothetical protein
MQEQDKRIQRMQDAPPLKTIFTMSVPVILGMMVMSSTIWWIPGLFA